MADDEGERAGGEAGRAGGRAVDVADHWLLYAVAITFMVISISALMFWGFQKLGWTGPASLFR